MKVKTSWEWMLGILQDSVDGCHTTKQYAENPSLTLCILYNFFFFFFKSLEETVLWFCMFSQSGTGNLKGHHLGEITSQHISKTLKM